MVKKLFVSIVLVVIIVTIFTINVFAVGVTQVVGENVSSPLSSYYTPDSKAYFYTVSEDIGYDLQGNEFWERFATTVPIVNPINRSMPSYNFNYRYPSLSDYNTGWNFYHTDILFESNMDDFNYNIGDIRSYPVHFTHQDYSCEINLDTPIDAGSSDFGFYIPKMYVWNNSISSAYGVDNSNSCRITLNNAVNALYVNDMYEYTFTIGVYGLDHTITCGIDPYAFLRFEEDSDGSIDYIFDFNITWSMLDGTYSNDYLHIYILDDDYEGVSVVDYFKQYIETLENEDISFSNDYIFEIRNIDMLLTSHNPLRNMHITVDTCDRTDLKSQLLRVNYHSIAASYTEYTGFISKAVSGFFTTQILPGFTLGGILLVVVAFSLVMWFLKLFAGG